MPAVSQRFNGGTVTGATAFSVLPGAGDIFSVSDNAGAVALDVANDLTVTLGTAHAALSRGLTVNPDSGGVYVTANTAAHGAFFVSDENGTDLIACSDGDTALAIRDIANALKLTVGTTGIGFYGHAQAAKPTVTGAKGGNAALTSLLSALAGLGLVTDSTT